MSLWMCMCGNLFKDTGEYRDQWSIITADNNATYSKHLDFKWNGYYYQFDEMYSLNNNGWIC